MSAERPLVSVLIPCYNASQWVGETLDSVFAQTYRPMEVIVVDDGSTDGSDSVLARYADREVTVIRQENRGSSAALNRCLDVARGELIQFLDADDLLSPEKIELQAVRLGSRRDAVAMSEWARFRVRPSEAKFVPDSTWRDQDPVSWLVNSWTFGGSMLASWLVPAAVVRSAGEWNEQLTLNNDGEYFARVLLSSQEVLFCGGARSYYRSGIVGSVSGRKTRAAWESQFLSVLLCEARLLERERSERTLRACATVWQVLAHASYPYSPDIANHALGRARALHPVTIRPEGGVLFRAMSRLLGWKGARRLQRLSGRY